MNFFLPIAAAVTTFHRRIAAFCSGRFCDLFTTYSSRLFLWVRIDTLVFNSIRIIMLDLESMAECVSSVCISNCSCKRMRGCFLGGNGSIEEENHHVGFGKDGRIVICLYKKLLL